jgi:hypothetical protein
VAALSDGGPGTLGHAGESETAMVLAYYAHLTDMARAPGGFVPTPKGTAPRHGHHTLDRRLDGDALYLPNLPEEFRAKTEARQGVVGDESLATAEKGRAMVAAIADPLSEVIADLRTKHVSVRVPPVVVDVPVATRRSLARAASGSSTCGASTSTPSRQIPKWRASMPVFAAARSTPPPSHARRPMRRPRCQPWALWRSTSLLASKRTAWPQVVRRACHVRTSELMSICEQYTVPV